MYKQTHSHREILDPLGDLCPMGVIISQWGQGIAHMPACCQRGVIHTASLCSPWRHIYQITYIVLHRTYSKNVTFQFKILHKRYNFWLTSADTFSHLTITYW